jgi:hypothetical protein
VPPDVDVNAPLVMSTKVGPLETIMGNILTSPTHPSALFSYTESVFVVAVENFNRMK